MAHSNCGRTRGFAGKTDPLRTCAIPERFWSGVSWRGTILSVHFCTVAISCAPSLTVSLLPVCCYLEIELCCVNVLVSRPWAIHCTARRRVPVQYLAGDCINKAVTSEINAYVIWLLCAFKICFSSSTPRAGSGVVRMDALRFRAGCRTRRWNQA